MQSKRARSTFGQFIDILGSAIAVSAAVENGRKPLNHDLSVLGIDSRQFSRIGRS